MSSLPKLNLNDADYRIAPYQAFTAIRERGPIYRARVPLIGKLWVVTTHEAVNEVLKDQKRFARDPKNAGKRVQSLLLAVFPKILKSFSRNMLAADGQDHRRLRSLVEKAFVRGNVDEMQNRILDLARQQLDRVSATSTRERIEFIDGFARPFPLAVICELLGLPEEDRSKFSEWFSCFSKVSSIVSLVRLLPSMFKLKKYLLKRFEVIRNTDSPPPGLITGLVQAELEGDRLDDEELTAMVFLLLIAGHETTVYLIGNAVLVMLQRPDIRAQLTNDWSLVDNFIEEVLRFASPVQFAKPRFVTADCQFHGASLHQGELVFPVLAAANFDPQEYSHPEEFRLDRKTNRHLSFGAGPHVCLGLKLARVETAIALHELFTRWPNLQADFDVENPDWASRMGMRALKKLPLHLDAD